MKPVINIVYDNGDTIVILSKNLEGLTTYEKAQEIRKFYTSETKQFETTIEYLIIDKLNDFGIIPVDDSDEAIGSALSILKNRYRKNIKIIDAYEGYKGKIIHKALNQTCIEEDNEISIANKIILEDL